MASITAVPRDCNLFKYKGFCCLKELQTPEYIDSLKDFKIRDDDIFLVTYPKSGTTWTQNILCLICSEGHRNGTEKINTSERTPWFECKVLAPDLDYNTLPSPRLFVTHLTETLIPHGLKNKKAKIIYVMRNPKDVIKSAYHFQAMAKIIQESPDFTQFFDRFLDGEVFAGSWFDHIRGWHNHKDDYNILFLKYEDMIKDLRSAVKQICTFIGAKLNDKEIDIVVKRATFKEMKKDPLSNKENLPENLFDMKSGSFIRKGQVGDWKNSMTVAQSELFDKIYQEKMGDLSLNFTWHIPE